MWKFMRPGTRWMLTCVCMAAASGCSSSRLALQSSGSNPEFPGQTSTSVPGSADIAAGNELRHPVAVHIAYARWQEKQKQLPQARESYEKALTHDPKSVEALLGLSRLDRYAGRFTEAEIHLQKAEKLRPNDPLVSAAWGEHYAAGGRWTEAVQRYRFAIEKAPDESIYQHQLAVVLARSGDLSGALATFGRVVGPAEAHYNVGYLLQQQGKLLEAEEQYQRAVALKPDLEPANRMLAKVRQERGVTTQMAAKTPTAQPSDVQPVAAQSQPQTGFQPAVWQSNGVTTPSGHTAPAVSGTALTPQQQEQWRNQQAMQAAQ